MNPKRALHAIVLEVVGDKIDCGMFLKLFEGSQSNAQCLLDSRQASEPKAHVPIMLALRTHESLFTSVTHYYITSPLGRFLLSFKWPMSRHCKG